MGQANDGVTEGAEAVLALLALEGVRLLLAPQDAALPELGLEEEGRVCEGFTGVGLLQGVLALRTRLI